MVYLVKERIMLELCKGAHIDVRSGHLPFAHFLDSFADNTIVHPFGIQVFRFFMVVETDVRVVQRLGVSQHVGDDFLPHLLVYLVRLAGDEELHLDGEQVLTESFFAAKERETCREFGINGQSLFILVKSDDTSHDGPLVYLRVFVPVSFQEEVQLPRIESSQEAECGCADHHRQVVGAHQHRLQQCFCFLGFRFCPERGCPSLVEQLCQGTFVYSLDFLRLFLTAFGVVIE